MPPSTGILKGDWWRISVAGTIAGLGDLQVGDLIYAKTTSASVGTDYFAIQGNVAEATTTILGLVMLATSSEAELKSSSKVVTCADLVNFSRGREATVTTDGIVSSFTVVHNLGKELKHLQVVVRDTISEQQQYPTIEKADSNSSNQIKITWSPAYPAGSFTVTITGL